MISLPLNVDRLVKQTASTLASVQALADSTTKLVDLKTAEQKSFNQRNGIR